LIAALLKQVSLLCLLALSAFPAAAREVHRAEIAEAFDPTVAPERRVYCSDTQVVTLVDGTEYRACVNWRAQSKSRLIRTYAALEGPDSDTDANVEIARACVSIWLLPVRTIPIEQHSMSTLLSMVRGRILPSAPKPAR